MNTYFIFVDAAYEMDFRQELDKIVKEYFIIPKVLYKGEVSQFDDIIWPGYRVGIILRANESLEEFLKKWGNKVLYFRV
ncbi:MAG: hypothetical protein ABIL49_07730 [candidate division WOR-3 bacterium]|jgi:hypothetical protein